MYKVIFDSINSTQDEIIGFNNYKKIVEKFSIDEKKYLFSETAIEAYNLDKSLLKKN